jgi:hypothetical protein
MPQNIETHVFNAKKAKKQAGDHIPPCSRIFVATHLVLPVKEFLGLPNCLAILSSESICTPGDEGLCFLVEGIRNIGYENVNDVSDHILVSSTACFTVNLETGRRYPKAWIWSRSG